MKKKIVVSFLILVVTACATKKNALVSYKTIDLEERIPLIEGDQDSICYHVEFHFTELTDYPNKNALEHVKKQLNEQFFSNEKLNISENPAENFKAMVDAITNEYREEALEIKKEYSEMSYMLNYELIKSSKIIYNKNEILVIEMETYVYSGGAHGIGNIDYLHFNMETGGVFGLNELFYDGGKQEISLLLQKKCNELKKNEDFMLFEDAHPDISENFYFDDKNIYFVYNPYEIAPYAAGYVSIEIPIENIRKWIDKKGPLGFLK